MITGTLSSLNVPRRGGLAALAEESERHGIWTLQAGIFPENTASLAVHRAYGFREVGRREKMGKMQDKWRDILLLERRSAVTGQDQGVWTFSLSR